MRASPLGAGPISQSEVTGAHGGGVRGANLQGQRLGTLWAYAGVAGRALSHDRNKPFASLLPAFRVAHLPSSYWDTKYATTHAWPDMVAPNSCSFTPSSETPSCSQGSPPQGHSMPVPTSSTY